MNTGEWHLVCVGSAIHSPGINLINHGATSVPEFLVTHIGCDKYIESGRIQFNNWWVPGEFKLQSKQEWIPFRNAPTSSAGTCYILSQRLYICSNNGACVWMRACVRCARASFCGCSRAVFVIARHVCARACAVKRGVFFKNKRKAGLDPIQPRRSDFFRV